MPSYKYNIPVFNTGTGSYIYTDNSIVPGGFTQNKTESYNNETSGEESLNLIDMSIKIGMNGKIPFIFYINPSHIQGIPTSLASSVPFS